MRLLGAFSLTLGNRAAGPWARPSARRLCELVLVSPERRIGREAACEALFPHLGSAAAANELRKALSMARTALSALGEPAAGLLMADRAFIQAQTSRGLEVDFEAHEEALRLALSMPPGQGRDDNLAMALEEEGTLLEDEPYAEWALGPREALEALRHEARLALAMDRSRGYGRSTLAEVVQAWEACFRADPSSEEAACALIRAYSAQGRHTLSRTTYDRCHRALEELGLRPSSALAEALPTGSPAPQRNAPPRPAGLAGERRLVSVLFAEVGVRVVAGNRLGPDDVGELVSAALAEVAGEVEALGGTVSSISGAGIVALFGAPEAHEDDPERAVRAALRSVAGVRRGGLFVRAGVETGQATVGLIGRSGSHYGAIGDAVGVAAALQSCAKPASVLVGAATQSAVEGLYEWGGAEEVVVPGGGPPVAGRYLGRPRPRALSGVSRRRLPGPAPLVGRAPELAALHGALRDLVAGRGGAVVLVSEPGLGKTRLVQETRGLFMAWVGAASGRLPLWLEGRAVSYGSALPYGLYQQLLCAWVGVASEEGDEVVRGALECAITATFGRKAEETDVAALLQVMGHGPGTATPPLSRLGPEQLQQACFGAVRGLVSRLMAHGPTVLTLEDLHWADPTSLKLTEEVASLTEEGPLLVVLTMRPEPGAGAAALETPLLRGAGAPRARARTHASR